MPSAKAVLQPDPGKLSTSEISLVNRTPRVAPHLASVTPVAPVTDAQPRKEIAFQPRVPVITGEAQYRGTMPVDGMISGQLSASTSVLTVKQRTRNGASTEFVPELDGELSFKDMLRINGYVAGKILSFNGTLIIDTSARVDADIDVAVCVISGTVNGDVIAHTKVELGPAAVINGNIATRSITMKPGAVFHGDCRMLKNENEDSQPTIS